MTASPMLRNAEKISKGAKITGAAVFIAAMPLLQSHVPSTTQNIAILSSGDSTLIKESPKENRCTKIEKIIHAEIHPIRPNIVMAIKSYLDEKFNPVYTLCYSKDFGKSWASKGDMSSFSIDSVDPRFVYGVSFHSILVSEDFGESFTETKHVDQFISMIVRADNKVSGKFYTATGSQDGGLFVLTGHGRDMTFRPFYRSMKIPQQYEITMINRKVWDFWQDPNSSDTFYVTTEDGGHANYKRNERGAYVGENFDDYYIIGTKNGGMNWEPFSKGLNWHSLIIRGFPDNSGKTRWFADTEGWGPRILDEKTKTWIKASVRGATLDHITDPSNPSRHFILLPASQPKQTIFFSEDFGSSWKLLFYQDDLTRENGPRSLFMDRSGNLLFGANNGIFMITKTQIEYAAQFKWGLTLPENTSIL